MTHGRALAYLIGYLAAHYDAYWRPTDAEEPAWRRVLIDGPTGQMWWLVHPDDMDVLPHVRPAEGTDPPWDESSIAEVYERLRLLTEMDLETIDG